MGFWFMSGVTAKESSFQVDKKRGKGRKEREDQRPIYDKFRG
jgi:hypothetical protein